MIATAQAKERSQLLLLLLEGLPIDQGGDEGGEEGGGGAGDGDAGEAACLGEKLNEEIPWKGKSSQEEREIYLGEQGCQEWADGSEQERLNLKNSS